MSRLFISHSSKDNISAIAFKQWLGMNNWPAEDVFLDLDGIGAGERWKDALRKANARCEAVVLLASPDALSSPECIAEIRKAEDFGKEVIVVLLRDLGLDDHRLDSYKDRQIVDLATPPLTHVEIVNYRGDDHEVRFNPQALARVKDYLANRGITPEHFPWPPQDRPNAEPFPGLSAFKEDESGIFFGRDSDIVRGLDKLRVMRRDGHSGILVIQAASGAGKSSYLRAGLWPRLGRNPDFAPLAILRPAQGILTGPEGLGRKLAVRLSLPGLPISPGDIHAQLMGRDESGAVRAFIELMTTAAARAHELRRVSDRDAAVPALVLAIDQAEELFASDDAAESERFLLLLGALMREPPAGAEPFAILTIRSDSAAKLFQTIADCRLEIPETLPILSLPQTSYRDVILKPLEVVTRRGQKLSIDSTLADRLIKDATGADALPLLAFALSYLYQEFGAGGSITLQQYEAMGGVARSIEIALKRALARPGDAPAIPIGNEEQQAVLRAAFIPWLARIDPDSGVPMRRVARLDDFPPASRAMVERLVEARLIVADRRSGIDVVEVAHESLLRQWPALTAWLQDDAEDLKIVAGIERAATEWSRSGRLDAWLDHRAGRLATAERLVLRDDFRKRLGEDGVAYLSSCRAREEAEAKEKMEALDRERRARRLRAVVVLLLAGVGIGLAYLGWSNQFYLAARIKDIPDLLWPKVLTATAEHSLHARDIFRECNNCPEMVVVPAGKFSMGSLAGETGRNINEDPQHPVTIAGNFAVSRFETTFDDWDACVALGGCRGYQPGDQGWGRGMRPVINVSWDDAVLYTTWLSKKTGKSYRLLTEAEFEYAARANSTTVYPWGNEIGNGNANCRGCGGLWDGKQPAPVASFAANAFGLFDMVGNGWEWVQDCWHANYREAPDDGSAWIKSCQLEDFHVVRGGSRYFYPPDMRSARRERIVSSIASYDLGFRVARTLVP